MCGMYVYAFGMALWQRLQRYAEGLLVKAYFIF